MIKPTSILLFTLMVNTGVFAQDIVCNPEGDTMEMAQCEADRFEKADRQLNAVYARLMQQAKDLDIENPPDEYDGAVKRLKEGQRAWVAWRDLECPLRSIINRGGSMERILFPACAANLTSERTKQLEAVIAEFVR